MSISGISYPDCFLVIRGVLEILLDLYMFRSRGWVRICSVKKKMEWPNNALHITTNISDNRDCFVLDSNSPLN